MKKTVLFLFLIALCGNNLTGQHLLRVNNNGFDPDYTALADAVAAASNGDTIYMEGSAIAYEGCVISKKLTIIGPGYFLGENPETEAVIQEVKFSTDVNFTDGSDGSTLIGCSFMNSCVLYINENNIAVYRNHLYTLCFNNDVSNILVTQNYIDLNISTYYSYIITNNIYIANNYVGSSISFGENSNGIVIVNNVFNYDGVYSYYRILYVYNANVQNNIFTCTNHAPFDEGNNNSFSYNLIAFSGTNTNHNQYGIDMATVFADYAGTQGYSTDGKWQLADNSPAIGAGYGGANCGMFGGATPYVLSGIPNLPHIYEADIPGAVSSGSTLSITIKVKSGD